MRIGIGRVLSASLCKSKKINITFKTGPIQKTVCKAMRDSFYCKNVSQNMRDWLKGRFRDYQLFPLIF